MFSIASDDIETLRPVPVRAIAISTAIILSSAIVVLLYRATDGFTRGTLRDLSSADRAVLDRIEQAGIRVLEKPPSAFGLQCVAVQVNWNRDLQTYVVSSLSLENAPFDLLLPFLRELSGLRELRAPYLSESELTVIRKQLPGMRVYRHRA